MEKKSNKTLKSFLTIVISLAFAGFFLWLALRGFDFKVVQKSLAKANYLWVAFAAVFALLAYWFRAIRWNLLLEPMGHKISSSNALWSLSFGYLMNLTIPRSGEVARATALYGVEKVPVDKSFGTIILERVVDLICMLGFLGLTLIFKYDAILAFYKNSGININPNKILIVIGGLAVAGVLFFVFKNKFVNVPVLGKIIGFIDGILLGLTSIFKLKEKGKFILYTIGIWVSYYFAAYLVCFALPETSDFTFADGFFIIVVGTLGMIIPASGGIGAFNLAMKYGFMALFLAMGKSAEFGGEMGLTYSFISLPLQIVVMLVMGLISIPMLAKARNTITEK
ncbi:MULTISPECIES: lysylphosphatidylglycerol synthase transmembrane domain-containing protein [Chryseobacterium]|uniref:lysylphosphatidylglycerol synthase transmembrane domain-containing protein n=1 Tax=Chryseobacterium TaxID=59732 RepID=UPI001911A088|nr:MULTISPECIES: lysylphosphatidylglycerol synthase transmembrane domain-containing protein [Chryseobacterium]MDQ8143120.1 lysylphosphatidylglycerol synthase transmembrane domain-containing protein [Chryseobacterium sp. CFS15]QQQ27846.1 flippase-like domain-containing protein [Chryseobacterium indoltheticum]